MNGYEEMDIPQELQELNENDNLFGARKAKRAKKKRVLASGATRKVARQASRKVAKEKRKTGLSMTKKKIKQTLGAAKVAPLLPFKKAMQRALSKKGIKTNTLSFPRLVEVFFNEIMSNKNDKSSNFDSVSDGYIADNWMFRKNLDECTQDDFDSLDPVTITAIVTSVIKFFKNKKEQKKALENAGENPDTAMSEIDLILAKEAEKVTKELEQKETNSKNVEYNDVKKIVKYVVIAVVLVSIIWYISKKA